MHESKLSYFLNGLSPDQRDELSQKLGISLDTFYRRRRDPGSFTFSQGQVLDEYITALNNNQPVQAYALFCQRLEVLPTANA